MGEGRAAVVLERAEHGIGVDLIASRSQETAAIIAAQVVTERGNGASIVKDVRARSAGFQDCIPDFEYRTAAVDDAAAVRLARLSLMVLLVIVSGARRSC